MLSIEVKEGESIEVAIRRFRRTCDRAGVIAEARRREFYEKPTWVRKRKAAAAEKRDYRRRMRAMPGRTRLY